MAFVITKPLEEHKQEGADNINQLASNKILAKYPLYRQLNIARTDQVQAMYDWIDQVRELATTAKTDISIAPTIVEIRSATTLFIDNLQLI